jgi:ABC-type transporter Mla subunit MlaD
VTDEVSAGLLVERGRSPVGISDMFDKAKAAVEENAPKLEGAIDKAKVAFEENAPKIEGAVDQAGQFVKDKAPKDIDAKVDTVVDKLKGLTGKDGNAT